MVNRMELLKNNMVYLSVDFLFCFKHPTFEHNRQQHNHPTWQITSNVWFLFARYKQRFNEIAHTRLKSCRQLDASNRSWPSKKVDL